MGRIAHATVGTELSQDEFESASTHTIDGTADLNVVRSATYIIAASSTHSYGRAQADAKCSGTADDVTINAGVTAVT